MFLSVSFSKSGRTSHYRRIICSTFLKVLSSDGFCVSRHQVEKLDFTKFFRWVHGQGSESVPRLSELARVQAQKRSEGSSVT